MNFYELFLLTKVVLKPSAESRVSAKKNVSQIGSVVFSVSAVVEKPLQFYIIVLIDR